MKETNERKSWFDRFLDSKRAMLIVLVVFFAVALAIEWLMPSAGLSLR